MNTNEYGGWEANRYPAHSISASLPPIVQRRKFMKEITVNRTHKSTVFRMLFNDKKEMLGLYNAVNHTSYTDVQDLEVRTLENAVYMKIKNDISFLFGFYLNIYEHQSTVNPNLPLRDLFYVASLLSSMTENENRYSTRMLRIPEPKFVVFYNGLESQEDCIIYRLSDQYERPSADPDLELRVTVLNINAGKNADLLSACKTLNEYAQFVEQIRLNCGRMEISEAVDEAVKYCIAHDILKDFLTMHRAEVTEMSIFEYDEEKHMRMLKEESREEGRHLGEDALGSLVAQLLGLGRIEDAKKAAEDAQTRKKLYREFNISDI